MNRLFVVRLLHDALAVFSPARVTAGEEVFWYAANAVLLSMESTKVCSLWRAACANRLTPVLPRP